MTDGQTGHETSHEERRELQPRTLPAPPARVPFEELILRAGHRKAPVSDLYAALLMTSWRVLLPALFAVFIALNSVFAALYMLVPGSIANARPGSFGDALFFSIETYAAIGFGFMYSQGMWGHLVVTVQAFVSLFTIAALTGLVFAKFSRPHGRVLFSDKVCIEPRNGIPTLTLRIANERTKDIVEASIRVSALKTTYTAEGNRMRRFTDLKLERSSTPVFMLSWQVFHPIDEDSPFYGMNGDDILEGDVRLIAAVTGLDSTFQQTIYARQLYWPEDIRPGHRFVDVIEPLEGGLVQIDYRKFHEIVPLGEDDT